MMFHEHMITTCYLFRQFTKANIVVYESAFELFHIFKIITNWYYVNVQKYNMSQNETTCTFLSKKGNVDL